MPKQASHRVVGGGATTTYTFTTYSDSGRSLLSIRGNMGGASVQAMTRIVTDGQTESGEVPIFEQGSSTPISASYATDIKMDIGRSESVVTYVASASRQDFHRHAKRTNPIIINVTGMTATTDFYVEVKELS